MKKAKVLTIEFQSWENFKNSARDALRDRKPLVGVPATIIFSSVVEYQRFMNEQKLALLAAICLHKPSSIYELAQLVDRDFANVQRDCVALFNMGFIKLEDAPEHARGARAPRLSFDYSRIVIRMPRLSYSHDLREAA